MTTPRPRSRVIGSIRAENGKGTVRMEDVYDTAIADVWSALTEPERLSRWIAEVTGDLRPGGQFHSRFTSGWDGSRARRHVRTAPSHRGHHGYRK